MIVIKENFIQTQDYTIVETAEYDQPKNERNGPTPKKKTQSAISPLTFILVVVGCIGFAATTAYVRFSKPGAKADFVEGDQDKNPKFNIYDVIQDGANLKFADSDSDSDSDNIDVDVMDSIRDDIFKQSDEFEGFDDGNRLRNKQNYFDQLKYLSDEIGTDEWFELDVTTTAPTAPTASTADSDQDDSPLEEQNSSDGDDFEPSSSDENDSSDDQNQQIPEYLLGYGATFVYNNDNNQAATNQAYEANSYNNNNYNSNNNNNADDGDSGSGDMGSGDNYVAPLSCWRCDGAKNWGECAQLGHLEQCEESATSCQLTIRKRDGEVEGIFTGCKQKEACQNNKAQNFVTNAENNDNDYSENQCRPAADNGPSVCRQCCFANNCNYNLDFMDILGWSQLLL